MPEKPTICAEFCILGKHNVCEVLEPDGITGPLDPTVASHQARYPEICIHFSCRIGLPAARLVYEQGLQWDRTGMQPFGTSEKPSGRFVEMETGLIWSQTRSGELKKTGQKVQY